MPSRSSRRNYNRIAGNQDDTESNALDEPLSPSSSFAEEEDHGNSNDGGGSAQDANNTGNATGAQSSPSSPLLPMAVALPIEHEIGVVLMDAAQSKFEIKCDKQWKIRDLKEVSAAITKVPPRSQRLIHMGKLLGDESTLDECGIKEDGKIIHLFPKPNVVINNGNSADEGVRGGNDDGVDDAATEQGAHVPQIVLDADEADRRSQILILSSQEIFEAQHRVKIFSFLLMIVSSMELLTLTTLFVGMQAEDPTGYGGGSSDNPSAPPGNPTDAPPSSSSSGGSSVQMRTWQDSDYFDALVSAFGFYVSLLGIRATTENTLRLAKRYFLCLVAAGVGSNCYYYYLNVQAEEKRSQERNGGPIRGSQLYTTAFVGILLPLTVWLLCIIRAYQFQSLIREAEVEAEERTRGVNEGVGRTGGEDDADGDAGGEVPRSLPYGSSDDLELAAERHGVSA